MNNNIKNYCVDVCTYNANEVGMFSFMIVTNLKDYIVANGLGQ